MGAEYNSYGFGDNKDRDTKTQFGSVAERWPENDPGLKGCLLTLNELHQHLLITKKEYVVQLNSMAFCCSAVVLQLYKCWFPLGICKIVLEIQSFHP